MSMSISFYFYFQDPAADLNTLPSYGLLMDTYPIWTDLLSETRVHSLAGFNTYHNMSLITENDFLDVVKLYLTVRSAVFRSTKKILL